MKRMMHSASAGGTSGLTDASVGRFSVVRCEQLLAANIAVQNKAAMRMQHYAGLHI
jgi:hypothetical protein